MQVSYRFLRPLYHWSNRDIFSNYSFIITMEPEPLWNSKICQPCLEEFAASHSLLTQLPNFKGSIEPPPSTSFLFWLNRFQLVINSTCIVITCKINQFCLKWYRTLPYSENTSWNYVFNLPYVSSWSFPSGVYYFVY